MVRVIFLERIQIEAGSSCRRSYGTLLFLCFTPLWHSGDWCGLTTSFAFFVSVLLPALRLRVLHRVLPTWANHHRVQSPEQRESTRTIRLKQRVFVYFSQSDALRSVLQTGGNSDEMPRVLKMPLLWLYFCFSLGLALVGCFLPHASSREAAQTQRRAISDQRWREVSATKSDSLLNQWCGELFLCPQTLPGASRCLCPLVCARTRWSAQERPQGPTRVSDVRMCWNMRHMVHVLLTWLQQVQGNYDAITETRFQI